MSTQSIRKGKGSRLKTFRTQARRQTNQAIPAVGLLDDDWVVERFVLAGTDYVYPRTTNKILESLPKKAKVLRRKDIMIQLHAVRSSDGQSIVSDVKEIRQRRQGKRAVVSTINGDANIPFYKELGNQGISSRRHSLWRFL